MPDSDAAQLSKLLAALSDTVVSLTVEHSDRVLPFAAKLTGVPNVSEVLRRWLKLSMKRR